MRRLHFILFAVSFLVAANAFSGNINDIRAALERSSVEQVQEKVYVHTDNTCYFVGDTLWYKAYVVRADNLHPTDMSRILYVELLNPDGLVVERQNIVVSGKGYSAGCFALRDSLYSGYYELRAYTRWMLNFGVGHKRYSVNDTRLFYNKQMAKDYFRTYSGLYSRVLPVYGKPEKPGDYEYKRMFSRPKQRLRQPLKPRLHATFYPEGGHLVEGVSNSVAFELTDQNGAAVAAEGVVVQNGNTVAALKPVYMGRGRFSVVPAGGRITARFTWRGKEYKFDLPDVESSGVALRVDGGRVSLHGVNLPAGRQYGVSVTCRGVLNHFQAVDFPATGRADIALPELPTGVNNITVFDDEARILADRLFFVNNHDYDSCMIDVDMNGRTDYEPYEKIQVRLSGRQGLVPPTFSVSVRDTHTDEPSYNDGNILTDLLLSSELKGFVAKPAYYFGGTDQKRAEALDLLMMVQGWRKYSWAELADTAYCNRRYLPEKSMTVEGAVYKTLPVMDVDPVEIPSWQGGKGVVDHKTDLMGDAVDTPETGITDSGTGMDEGVESGFLSTDDMAVTISTDTDTDYEMGDIHSSNDILGVNHGGLKGEVLVEAEMAFGDGFAGSVQKTHSRGRFLFEIPPYYGTAVLKLKAYKESDSIVKAMSSRKDADALNADAYPDYYVKRDLFFPVHPTPYSYYQNHAPEYVMPQYADSVSEFSMENDNHLLQNVDVKGRTRRARRAIDYSKPAFVADAYDVYNLITDYGLSFGRFDMRQFPVSVCRVLYGNMDRYRRFNVDGRYNGQVYYRNYSPDKQDGSNFWDNRSAYALYPNLKLNRMMNLRVFSDYEPRNVDTTYLENRYVADATVEVVPIPDNGVQPTFRDRHIILPGFNQAVAFYSPDYSARRPDTPADYRRTLYWNPNARPDSSGTLTVTLYNNSKPTRIAVSAAALAPDGSPMFTK